MRCNIHGQKQRGSECRIECRSFPDEDSAECINTQRIEGHDHPQHEGESRVEAKDGNEQGSQLMDQWRIGNDCKTCIPTRFPQREPVLCVMVCKKHMGISVVAKSVARAEDEHPVKQKRDEDGKPQTTRHYSVSIFPDGI